MNNQLDNVPRLACPKPVETSYISSEFAHYHSIILEWWTNNN